MSRQVKKIPENCPEYTKKWVPNGCGPKGGVFAKVSSFVIPELIFGGACNCHDFAYFFGGCKAIDDSARYKADREFYLDMIARIELIYFWRRPFYKLAAKAYFEAVRGNGQDSFTWFKDINSWVSHLLLWDLPIPEYLRLAASTEGARLLFESQGGKIEAQK